jgi:hypothetical protein
VLGRYYNGVVLQVLDQSGNWSQVRIHTRNGFRPVTGYMLTKSLNTYDSTVLYADELPRGIITYSQGYGLKLRERAESTASPLGEYPENTSVQVLSKGGDWLHVAIGDFTGFMQSKYIKITESDTNAPSGAFSSALAVRADKGQSIPVYSGPGTHYIRGANGKASIGSNDIFYFYGYDQSADGSMFACVRYETSGGAHRIGYIESIYLTSYFLQSDGYDDFLVPEAAEVTKSSTVTDDPLGKDAKLTSVQKGTSVTLLATIQNGDKVWAYIEGTDDKGQLFRGFVPDAVVAR